MMRYVFFVMTLLFFPLSGYAAVYNLNDGDRPPCSGSWSGSGGNFRCGGQITLTSGNQIVSNQPINLTADGGFDMSGGTVGSTTTAINIASSYSAISISGTVTLNGSVENQSGEININGATVIGDVHSNSIVTISNSDVSGEVSSQYGNITLNNTYINGDISSNASVYLYDSELDGNLTTNGLIQTTGSSINGSVVSNNGGVTMTDTIVSEGVKANGDINLTGGSIQGEVWSTSNKIITSGANLLGGARAQSGMTVSGGTLSGDFVMTSYNQALFENVVMLGGSITGDSSVRFVDSQIGSSDSPVYIRAETNDIDVEGSTIYGTLEAAGCINVDSRSQVIGECTPSQYCPAASCSAAVGVERYVIEAPNNAVTCEAAPIRVFAYDNNGNLTVPASGTTVTLSSTGGFWPLGNEGSFNGTDAFIQLPLSSPDPGTWALNAFDGSASAAPANITFADTGLLIRDSSGNTLPTMIAGTVATDAVLRVVQTNSETGACESRVQGTQTVSFGYQCINPSSCVAGQSFAVNNTDTASAVTVNFDADGRAPLELMYTDVGQVTLNASLALLAQEDDPAITLTGQSNPFVVKPHTLAVTVVEEVNGNANPAATDDSDGGFVAAGEAFRVVIEAQNSAGSITPNYGNELDLEGSGASDPELAELTAIEIVYPVGGDPGSFIDGSAFAAIGNGLMENTTIAWNQVGSFTAVAQLQDDDYLGAGSIAEETRTGTIGRFYPDHFELDVGASVVNACSPGAVLDYSYMGQRGIDVNYTLKAVSANGTILSNYDSDPDADMSTPGYGSADVNYVYENNGSCLRNEDGQCDFSRLSLALGEWEQGVFSVTTDQAAFSRGDLPETPLLDLQLGLMVEDTLDGRLLADLNINPSADTNCLIDDTCTAVSVGQPLRLAYGRFNLGSAYGPEILDLPVRVAVEYYTENGWATMPDDSCTRLSRSDVVYPEGSIDVDENRIINIGGGTSRGEHPPIHLTPTSIQFLQGIVEHHFTAPGRNNTGKFEVDVNLQDYPWLTFDWDGDGEADETVTGRYQFGSYRGHDRIIYWREVLD